MKSKFVPEFQTRSTRFRAGFIPSDREETEVEVWTLWCKESGGNQDDRRATKDDMRAAGYKKKGKRR